MIRFAQTLCLLLGRCGVMLLTSAIAIAQPATAVSRATSALRSPAAATDLLRLGQSSAGAPLPVGWRSRSVRGQGAPMTVIIDSAGLRYLHVSGAARAAWFVRELDMPLSRDGNLSWQWRVPLAPVGSDIGSKASDDAALRVFVVFGRRGMLDGAPRALFYTIANGRPAVTDPTATDQRRFGVVSAGHPDLARDWVGVSVNPFADYRRFWHADADRIVAVGIMQDTDQTRSPAVGDVLTLEWRPTDAPRP